MAKTIQMPLSENDIKFMEIWRNKVLTRKYNISMADVEEAAGYLAFRRSGTCSSCNRNDVIEMNNIYNRLNGQYEQYLAAVAKAEEEVQLEKNRIKSEKAAITRNKTQGKKGAEYLKENLPKKPWVEGRPKKNEEE